MMRVLISNMSASRVNLLQNDYASGLPSPTAFLGLADVIGHALGFDRWSMSVLPVLHQVMPSAGRTRPEFIKKGRKFSATENVEDMHGHVKFSMLLDLPEPRAIDQIRAASRHRFLAGGAIFPDHGSQPITVSELPADGQGFRKCALGRVLVPGLRDDMAGTVSFGDPGSFAKLKSVLMCPSTDENPTPGFRVPVAIGYRLITTPGQNPVPACARDDKTPHVFAEPGVGVAELVSVRNPRLTDLDEPGLSELFWRWSASGDHITAHPVYNPNI
jgi:hypothetical protein